MDCQAAQCSVFSTAERPAAAGRILLLTASDRPDFPEEGGVSIFMTVHDSIVDERRSRNKPTLRRETGEPGGSSLTETVCQLHRGGRSSETHWMLTPQSAGILLSSHQFHHHLTSTSDVTAEKKLSAFKLCRFSFMSHQEHFLFGVQTSAY